MDLPIKVTEFIRKETESLEDIYALLEGRIFHVTKLSHLSQILSARYIHSNLDLRYPTPFGNSENGFFRNLNCVSVFDYREEPTDEINFYRNKCSPFLPARPPSEGIAILIFKPDVGNNLLSWLLWKESKAFSEMVVPHVEAGYPGSISTDFVEEIISLKIVEDPKSLRAIFEKHRFKEEP
jgi:hypothetical protein